LLSGILILGIQLHQNFLKGYYMPPRPDGRENNEIRKITLTRGYLPYPEGSCLVEMGMTKVIITASVEESLPQWLRDSPAGWVTAEYGMLPRSTHTRNRRMSPGQAPNGRTMEIQRLIGRSLRAVTDLKVLGSRTVNIDCDVICADGGTRTASIIGAAVALYDCGEWLTGKGLTETNPVKELVAGISVGLSGDETVIDLCYAEDSEAMVDMNIVMTESGKFVEVQGTGEHDTFSRQALDKMIDLAEEKFRDIFAIQRKALE
jgi:ribonuclease PH